MKYIAETAALVAALSATGAQAAPSQNNKLFNNPSFGILPYTGNPAYYADPKDFVGRTGPAKRDAWPAFFGEAQVGTAEQLARVREQLYLQASGNAKREAFIDNQPKVIPDTRPIDVRLREYKKLYPNLYPSEEKRNAFVDNMPKVIPHPGGIEGAIEEARRLYPEIYQRNLEPWGLEDFLGLPDTSVNPNFGNTGTFGKKRSANPFVDTMPKVVHDPNFNLQEYLRLRNVRGKPLQQREANAFFDNQPKVVYDKNFEDVVYNRRGPFQLQQREAVLRNGFPPVPVPVPEGFQFQHPPADAPIYSGGYRGGKERWQRDLNNLLGLATKRNAEAEPFLADIGKLIGMGIDKATKRDAAADPFLADIAKVVGMGIDKAVGKREAAADPFLADIAKLVGKSIDTAT
ncbi:hypothetical protein CB0940_12002 [Cercospora beticola]|uniref:Uncharacterized protein n=1 Tax=Cercospora beticola TaxID=122368 RepID=A0A2G5IE03_CERBT|nr:hypothetical protein CB0940_12002 [Cercospora beticola]PIB02892.1 hypothetical protein CB0940_12002 [Cercospora beticola]WPB04384.1 hypothetical protein RHO25_009030 [Cercospora beticola]CAK1356790.1 unnamed protein product [Cercospora beticola]